MPKIIFSEHVHSYRDYAFGYAIYAQRMEAEALETIYEAGFLPYTGNLRAEVQDLYYMARSARVRLDSFSLNSENRRIRNKFKDQVFTVKEYPASSFFNNGKMFDFCLGYFEKRHGPGLFSRERLIRVLSYSPETKIVEYKDQYEVPRAYIIEIDGQNFTHYWFSFYDLSMAYRSFGMWLMMDRVENAKTKGKKYCYLGTVYGHKALYKTNLPSLEYWNGATWMEDIKRLKARAKTDEGREVQLLDEFKNNEI